MRKELDDLLCQRFPKIFVDRHGDKTKTAMAIGFDCSDGWFDLIDTLCEQLQEQSDSAGAPQVAASQVKQKFGKLRFEPRREPWPSAPTNRRKSACCFLRLKALNVNDDSGKNGSQAWRPRKNDVELSCDGI